MVSKWSKIKEEAELRYDKHYLRDRKNDFIQKLRLCKRDIIYFYQKLIRGFDDSEMWNLDGSLAKLILPRLIRFKEVTFGFPNDLTPETWDEILDKMIYSFEYLSSDKKYEFELANSAQFEKVQEGLDLFAKYYMALWY